MGHFRVWWVYTCPAQWAQKWRWPAPCPCWHRLLPSRLAPCTALLCSHGDSCSGNRRGCQHSPHGGRGCLRTHWCSRICLVSPWSDRWDSCAERGLARESVSWVCIWRVRNTASLSICLEDALTCRLPSSRGPRIWVAVCRSYWHRHCSRSHRPGWLTASDLLPGSPCSATGPSAATHYCTWHRSDSCPCSRGRPVVACQMMGIGHPPQQTDCSGWLECGDGPLAL